MSADDAAVSATEATLSPTKRKADQSEVGNGPDSEKVDVKKAKNDTNGGEPVPVVDDKENGATDATAAAGGEDEDEDDLEGELSHLDQDNIIVGKRTRGKQIDYSKVPGADAPDEDDEEEDADAQPDEEEGGEGEEEEEEEGGEEDEE